MASKREQAINAVVEALTAQDGLTVQELQSRLDPRLLGGIDAAQSRGMIRSKVAYDGQRVTVTYHLREGANNG